MARQTEYDQQWYPEPEQEQKDKVEAQEHAVVASLPVVQEVLDWFDSQIESYADPLKIDRISPNSDAEQVKQALLFAQTVMQDYRQKRIDFERTFERYIQDADGA